MNLSSKDKKELRGHAQTLRASIIIGKSGITKGVLETIEIALKKSELIKIRFTINEIPLEEQCAPILEHTSAVIISTVGKTVSIYKPAAEANS
jgi:RNA-binding protein